ncbi:MAG TPA: NADH-quinone oxidoreductase subunit N [Polyangia bacterium]
MTGGALSNAASWRPLVPELILAVGTIAVLAVGLGRRAASRGWLLALAFGTLLAAMVATPLTAVPSLVGEQGAVRGLALFGGLLARDGFADFFKLLFGAAGAVVVLASFASREGRGDEPGDGALGGVLAPAASLSSTSIGPPRSREASGDRDGAEYAALLLSVVLGADLMAAATDLLTAYLALEFVSLLSYVLAAFGRRSRRSAEAGLKYAIYGGVATGAMLYGFSWLYGLAGTTELAGVRAALATAPPLVSGTVLALCLTGLGFKMAVVPFHTWCPDVYEGAPTPVAAFFSVVPKAAGFALAFRFLAGAPEAALSDAGAALVTGQGPATVVASVLAVIAMVSMTLGNLAAIPQRNLKRLLAYSSIAQAGNLAMALAVGSAAAERALLVYLGIYLFMNLAAFVAVTALVRAGEGEALDDLAGLGGRAPLLSLGLTVALLSLAGLPPLGGFVAKFAMFSATIERGAAGGGPIFYALAAAGVVNTVVSVYYYARVAKIIYFDRPRAGAPARLRVPLSHAALVGVTAAGVVALGIYAPPLTALAERSLMLFPGP